MTHKPTPLAAVYDSSELGGVMPSEDMKGFPLAVSLNANFLAEITIGSI
jgi:hypothetical protein